MAQRARATVIDSGGVPNGSKGCALVALAGVMAAAGMAVFLPGTVVAQNAVRASCKPPIFTSADVAAALGVPTADVSLVPLAASGIPPVRGKPQFRGKTFECDWNLSSAGQSGFGEGRVSIFALTTPAEAKRWFTAYTAEEAPPCKKVSFKTPACVEILPLPYGVFPLFQAIQGRFVVWIHMKQLKLDLRPLEALVRKVFARAPHVA